MSPPPMKSYKGAVSDRIFHSMWYEVVNEGVRQAYV